MRAARLVSMVAMLAGAKSLSSQQPVQIAFGPPDAAVLRGFTRLGGVRELDRVRAVILDVGDREVLLVDFLAKRATPVARRGQGPGEYARPVGLVALPGGRTLIQDAGNGRFLEIGPTGTIAGIWAPGSISGRPVMVPPLTMSSGVWSSDHTGRLYFEQSPKESTGIGPVAIARLDPQSTEAHLDTVATFALTGAMGAYSTTSQDRTQVTFRRRIWPPRPEWVVSSEGVIGLVHPEPYRVAWVDGTNRIEGPVVPYTPIKVTEADREAWLETAGQPIRARGAAGPGGASFAKQEAAPEFPEVMPPFLGREAIHAAPDGRVWVQRAASLADTVHTYDVFDLAGRLAARATLPSRRRVIGFGERAVYVARRDADDVEYLERYPFAFRP